MEEVALEIPKPTRRNERDKQGKTASSAGAARNEIFDTLPDTTPGDRKDPFEIAVQALTNYFTPRRNREYEIYVFRQAKQEKNETILALDYFNG